MEMMTIAEAWMLGLTIGKYVGIFISGVVVGNFIITRWKRWKK